MKRYWAVLLAVLLITGLSMVACSRPAAPATPVASTTPTTSATPEVTPVATTSTNVNTAPAAPDITGRWEGAITVQGALAEPQLRLCIRQALEVGATQREIAETIYQMSMFGGLPAMQKALEIAQSVYAEEDEE